MRTLVVEPSKTFRLLLNNFLHGFAIEPNAVSNGAGALKAVGDDKYDLICIAMYLPDMKGADLAKKIKSIKGMENSIIIVFANEQNDIKLIGAKTGDINYIFQRKSLAQLKSLFSSLTKNHIISYDGSGYILFVEDNRTQADITIEMLKQMGLSVDHFMSAEAALIALEEHDYDLILLDIILQGEKDGVDMIDEVRSRQDSKKFIPIVAISALLGDSQRIRALKMGANDFIHKPYIEAELAIRLKNMLVMQHLYKKVIAQKETLEKMAMTDQLTDLYNRHFLMPYVKQALSAAKRHGYALTMMMIDLDKFKTINDELGHEAGDKLLCNIAKIIKRNCRAEDAAIRLGGDEFLLIMPNCQLSQAVTRAESLKIAINQLPPKHYQTSASFGLSSTEEGNYIFEQLFSMADYAAYQAKIKGGNDICF